MPGQELRPWLNALLHTVHINGFTPLWTRRCHITFRSKRFLSCMNTQVPGHIRDSLERFIAYSAHKWFLFKMDAQMPHNILVKCFLSCMHAQMAGHLKD